MISRIKSISKKISDARLVKRLDRKNNSNNASSNPFTEDFPILINRKVAYLDNAATTQKPKIVIDKLKNFYEMHNANSHRGLYKLSEEATQMLESARGVFARFINASHEEIIFTRNSTEALNGIASSLERSIKFDKGSNVVTTVVEHHSNFVPWQQICKRTGAEFKIMDFDMNTGTLDDVNKYVDSKTVVFSITGMSNVTGYSPDLKKIISTVRLKNKNTLIVIDATQLIAHKRIDVRDMDADFLVFSAHKLYGPSGVGVLYGKRELLEKIEPFSYGGGMINRVNAKDSDWAELPDKFEAGTIDTPGIVAAAEAINYLESKFKTFTEYENKLKEYALAKLREIPSLKVIGHNAAASYGPVISFAVDNIHPHDMADICGENDVCIRAGHHCCQPLMRKLDVMATSRMSIGMYNTEEDIDRLIKAINYAIKLIGIRKVK